jgi:flagellar biosynthesis/type III secretory pathway M-ring protein FliF/YscJ
MKNKSAAVIIMLFAGTVIAFTCLFNKIALVPSLLYISATLLFFYIIGLIIAKIITKINTEAELRAKELIKMQKEAALREQEEQEEQEEEPEDSEESQEQTEEGSKE